jgi:hypothetical protein
MCEAALVSLPKILSVDVIAAATDGSSSRHSASDSTFRAAKTDEGRAD